MNGKSLNIREDNLQKLKELFPDVFSEEKIVKEKTKTAPKIKKSEENEDEK